MIIPFFIPHAGCPHQCVFCDQRRITGARRGPDPASVPATIRQYLKTRPADTPVQVAFYGGSFTALRAADRQAYLEQVQPFIRSGAVAGIRVSTRPDAITPAVLSELKRFHVTTVELGVQSLNESVLRLSSRGHSAEDAARAVGLLREEGFTVGVQLMPGLPGDSSGIFRRTVGGVIALRPDFVRIYPTLVIRGTPLERLYYEGRYLPLTLEAAVVMSAEAMKRFREAGIPVIRAGLQATEELERPETVVAGPYHPAFRQLVDSSLFLELMRNMMSGDGDITFLVHPSDLSSAIGQKRRNIASLREHYRGAVKVLPDPRVPRGTVSRKQACTLPGDGL
jgi:histone acetyltransferase (RNA polymerase elongator complex component)